MKQKVSTYIFMADGETITITFYLLIGIRISRGIWNIETNDVFLNKPLLDQWNNIKNNQPLQRKFFNDLKKVTPPEESHLFLLAWTHDRISEQMGIPHFHRIDKPE